MNKYSILFILALACLSACSQKTNEQANETNEQANKPNVILIMLDDMGYSDLGYFGSNIETPSIDYLAENGIIFNQFYNTSRCCPSRAALLTGLYQHQTGMGDMAQGRNHINYQGFLNKKCATIAEVLKSGGYQTIMSGKWHLGNNPAYWPHQRGFEQFYGIPEGGGVYFYPFQKERNVVLNDSILELNADYYTTTAFNEYAAKFVKEALAKDQPFFLYLPHIAPHFPLQAPKERYQKYLGKFKDGFQKLRAKRLEAMKTKQLLPEGIELSQSDSAVLNWDSLSEEDQTHFDLEMAIYAAQLEMADEGIGELIQILKDKQQLENTMIIFLSDNGASHEAPHLRRKTKTPRKDFGTADSYQAYDRSWAHVSNTPFRMYKHWVHEGGISSPLIIHYPTLIKEPRTDNSVLHIMDIMPTILELSNINYPENEQIYPLEGKSFLPLLNQAQAWKRPTLFWEHEGNRAVRKEQWKIVSAYPQNEWHLYNIEKDRMESQDLSEEYPEIKAELIQAYDNWANRIGVVPFAELIKMPKKNQ